MNTHPGRWIVLFALMSLPVSAQQHNLADDKGGVSGPENTADVSPSPATVRMAEILGVGETVRRLSQVPARARAASIDALLLRQTLTEATLATSLEIDGVLAQIDDEVANLASVRAELESRRDRQLSVNNVANLVAGSTVGVLAGTLGLHDSTSKAGDIVGLTGGAVSTALSWVGLRQQHGGKREVGATPNMLAPIFGLPAELYGGYPKEVWEFLNTTPSDETKEQSRRLELIGKWTKAGLIPPAGDPKAAQRIGQLTSGISQQRKLSIKAMNDRATMLADVRVEVALMKRDMSALMHFVSALVSDQRARSARFGSMPGPETRPSMLAETNEHWKWRRMW
jgi:hypothetical protein